MSAHDGSAMRKMRREFARLITEDRESFRACVAEYQERGEWYFEPMEKTAKNRVPKMTLSFLLARYRTRARGVSKIAFCEAEAAQGVRWGNRFSGGFWKSSDAIEAQLKRAMRLEKDDPEFAYEVDFMERFFLESAAQKAAGESWDEDVP